MNEVGLPDSSEPEAAEMAVGRLRPVEAADASRCNFCQHPRTPGDPCRDCYEDGMTTR